MSINLTSDIARSGSSRRSIKINIEELNFEEAEAEILDQEELRLCKIDEAYEEDEETKVKISLILCNFGIEA